MECVFSFGELLLVVVLLPLLVGFYQSSDDVFLCCCIGCCDVFDRLSRKRVRLKMPVEKGDGKTE
jgi:hypothetical protein